MWYDWKEKLVDGLREWIFPPLAILLFAFLIFPVGFASIMFTKYIYCNIEKTDVMCVGDRTK